MEAVKLTIPSASEQRHIIASLEAEEESLHVYAVTKPWYDSWRTYVGLNDDPSKDSMSPGALVMDVAIEENNMYVDEKIWVKWVDWYGISPEHELDRRNCSSDEKELEICILNQYSGILENPRKSFDITEETGYVELQLRRIFSIPENRKSRLWACEKIRHSRFTQLLDRNKDLFHQEVLDAKKSYILALEVGELDGKWPSQNPGNPRGSFQKYSHLVGRCRESEYWEKELANTLDTVFNGISNELKETVSGIVSTTKVMTSLKEADLGQVKERLETRIKSVDEVQKSLNKKAKDMIQEDELMKTEVRRLKRDRDVFEQERTRFHEEQKKMQELNKIRESRIKLNIGGHTYMTSTMTLMKDSDSMFSAMFSGRHNVTQEEDGAYFVDRDGTHFRYILNFLRDGGFREGALPMEHGFLNELLTEAEFYQINGLVRLLSDFIKGKGQGEGGSEPENSPKPERRHPSSKRPHRKVAMTNPKS